MLIAIDHGNKQVKTAADLAGSKVRGPTRQITKMLSYLGASPVGVKKNPARFALLLLATAAERSKSFSSHRRCAPTVSAG